MIDYLVNAFTPDREKVWDDSIAAQGVQVKVRRDPEDSFCTVDEMVRRMDHYGITTVVMPASDLSVHNTLVEYDPVAARFDEMEALHAANPGRFVAWWAVNPNTGSVGLRRMRQVLERPWAVGMWIHTHSFDRRFDHQDFYPYYGIAADLGVPVVMQAGTSGGLMPSECGHPIGIDRPAMYFRDVNFILSHLGWPWTEEAIAMALKFSNVYLGTGAYPPSYWWPNIVDFIRRPGRRKVLFGTNFPTVGYKHVFGQLDALGFTDEVKQLVLHENARRIITRLPS